MFLFIEINYGVQYFLYNSIFLEYYFLFIISEIIDM